MSPELQTIVDLINSNGGTMAYADIFNNAEVQPFNQRLDNLKREGKRLGAIKTLPLAKDENGRWVARWTTEV